MTGRDVRAGIFLACLIACWRPTACGADATTAPRADVIGRENALPGSTDWQLTRVRLDSQTGTRSSVIEGYCSRQSVGAGDTLEIFVSTNPPQPYRIEIFRTGYYGGHSTA